MHLFSKNKAVSAVVLAAYVLAGILLEVSHCELFEILLHPDARLASHTCGAHENHVSLDEIQPCQACAYATHSLSTPATSCLPARQDPPVVVAFSNTLRQPVHVDCFSSGTRGPPPT
jgi:hypothetical protein